jgi:hypothetical protein
MEAVLKQYKY